MSVEPTDHLFPVYFEKEDHEHHEHTCIMTREHRSNMYLHLPTRRYFRISKGDHIHTYIHITKKEKKKEKMNVNASKLSLGMHFNAGNAKATS